MILGTKRLILRPWEESDGIYEDMSFLETFLRNLLMGEHNELKNRYMHIRGEETAHSSYL